MVLAYPALFSDHFQMSAYILPRTGILSYLDDEAREQLTTYGKIMHTPPGQMVIEDGAQQICLYLILEGTYRVTKKAGDHEIHLDTLQVGECFGEVAIFMPGNATASVTSEGTGQLWYMDVEHLQQFLLDWPHPGCGLILAINTILSRRLKRANGVIKTNAIVPSFLSVRSRKRNE